jgi:hypothetical protein
LLVFPPLQAIPPGDAPSSIESNFEFFEKKVRPVLVQQCYECHSAAAKKLKGGLRLDSREGIRKGGDSGPALAPGRPENSLLIKAIGYQDPELKMPPKGKLPDAVIADLEEWVRRGAPDPRRAHGPATSAIASEAGRKFWAFQRPRRTSPPPVRDRSWPRSPIDQFILAKLEANGLAPGPDADRYTLLRRVTFDLVGLPPTPEEIETFASDWSPQAFAKVVDRLLASPAFGERWARHWLDLTCFADLADVDGNVVIRDAWRYRDYVIAALNQDKPFDRFILEQLAGDLLPAESAEKRREQIIATGFLAIGPWALQNYIKAQLQADVVDHQIDKIGRVFLGMSLACARCHDHKFDPVLNTDYYALAGIFHSTQTVRLDGPGVWSQIVRMPLPELPEELGARTKATQECERTVAQIREGQKRLNKERKQLASELAVLEQRKPAGAAERKQPDRTAERKRLQAAQQAIDQKLQELADQLQLVQYNRAATPEALAVRDAEKPADCPVYIRGSFQSLGPVVPRGVFLFGITGRPAKVFPSTSGRLELAQWLTDPANPLTARVAVNRLWHHLFGAGLVRSVDYFGTRGEAPTHPELLDYLAVRFLDNGWPVKALIREMVLSRTYQMASAHNAVASGIDPGNRLLWRMNRRRHEAEAIRDAILSVSGQLDHGQGGPSLGLDIPGNVNGIGGMVNPPTYSGKMIPASVRNRRTVYLPLFRKRPEGDLEILSVYDFPHPSEITGARASTTVPTQALFLMNSPFLKEQARRTAARLLDEKTLDDAGRVGRLHLLAFNRPASTEEIQRALVFLDEFERALALPPQGPDNRRWEAWAQLCHALLASNEFLFKE